MRIAVIGCGSIGRRHIENLLAMGERDLLIYDTDWETQWGAGIDPCIHACANIDVLWEKRPEAVLICTPPETHEDLMWEAYHHDADVFIEKPLSNTHITMFPNYDQKIIGAGCNWVNMVACNWRFHPGPLALKRWLDEGAIGEVLSARISMGYYLPDTKQDYRDSYAATTGVTLDVGSHAVDLAVWLLGPARLCSAVVRPAESIGLKGTDGLAELLLEHKGGAVSSIGVNWLQRGVTRDIEIIGTKGHICWHWDMAFPHAVLWEGLRLGEVVDLKDVGFDEMYYDQLAHFLACVRENRPTCNPVSSAVDVLGILLEAKQC